MTSSLTRLGPYEIIGMLGEGGMGTVYRARDPRLDRIVALKVLRQDTAADPDRQARFVQEAKSVSALNHPNIVTVHDVGVHDGMAYMVMELVEGQSLDQLIPSKGMRVSELLRIASQVADAFADAHAAKIVHRDLKPANVMLQPNGRVKVLDFGLAKLIQADAGQQSMVTQTAAGTIVGTAAYMSPEQAEGRPLDARSDVFSFGAMLYEMCSGQRAFPGDSQASVLAEVLRDDPRPLRELRGELPQELTRTIMRCLRKDPTRRVQSMADLKLAFDDLREELDSGKLAAVTSAAPIPHGRRWSWMSAAVGAAVGAIVVAAVMLLGPRGQDVSPDADSALTPLPLTTYPGRETFPSLSSDGNSVAFSWTGEHQDNTDIYVQLIGAGSPLRLTSDPKPDLMPAWSPDGRYIAFVRRIERERIAVMLVPALGGGERRLGEFDVRLTFDNPITDVVWTPDAKYLFVGGGVNGGVGSDIQRINVETGEIRNMVKVPAGKDAFGPFAISPDGRTLAAALFPATPNKSTMLFKLSAASDIEGDPMVAPIPQDVNSLAFTPDGREIVYRIAVNVPLSLYRVKLPDGKPVPMPWLGADAFNATFSGAKHRLVFTRNVRDTNIWRVALDTVDSGTPALDQVAASSFREAFPQYSPDGKRLAFYSNRSASVQIWTSNIDGTNATQLTNLDPMATTGSPRWSPDGARIIFDSSAGGTYHVYEIAADGGQPRALTPDTSNAFSGAYSPDGKTVYFTSDRSGRNEVWRQPVSGGDAEQVTKNGGNAPTMSPDGAWIYFAKEDQQLGLWRLPAAGGVESRVATTLFRYNYAVTPKAIYYMSAAAPAQRAMIRRIDIATGREKDLVQLDKTPDLGLAVSPDGRYLLFTKLDYAGADLMLVENFR